MVGLVYRRARHAILAIKTAAMTTVSLVIERTQEETHQGIPTFPDGT